MKKEISKRRLFTFFPNDIIFIFFFFFLFSNEFIIIIIIQIRIL